MLVADQLAENDPQKPVVTKFIADYKAKYGQNPSTFAGHAYDGFMIAVEALKTAGTDKAAARHDREDLELARRQWRVHHEARGPLGSDEGGPRHGGGQGRDLGGRR